MTSFQGVKIEGFQVSSFQGVVKCVYRGVLISVCWNRGFPLYTEMSSFQRV